MASPRPKLASHRVNRERSSGSSAEPAVSVDGASGSIESLAPAESAVMEWSIHTTLQGLSLSSALLLFQG